MRTQYQRHVPCGSCIYVKFSDEGYSESPQVNMGGNAAEKLLDPVLTAATICRQHLANETPFLSLCLFVLLCSTSTLVNVQLRKIILKKISLSWWTTRSLVSLFIFMFICSFMFLCIDSFIDSFIANKTIENLKNRRAVDLEASEEKPKKLVPQTSFKLFKIFNENLVAVEWANVELTLSWPIYVEFAILDLLKTLMYDFHYNYIKRKYSDLTLLFTDTDSLTC